MPNGCTTNSAGRRCHPDAISRPIQQLARFDSRYRHFAGLACRAAPGGNSRYHFIFRANRHVAPPVRAQREPDALLFYSATLYPMLPKQQQQLISFLQTAVARVAPDTAPTVVLERPKVAAHGDIACNIAMQMAKQARRQPRELAQAIVSALQSEPGVDGLVASIDIAGPGFINFHLTADAHHAVLEDIAQQGARYGFQPPNSSKVLVEFVSANPTGPLHVGHARQAALGDSLCRMFSSQGYAVTRDF